MRLGLASLDGYKERVASASPRVPLLLRRGGGGAPGPHGGPAPRHYSPRVEEGEGRLPPPRRQRWRQSPPSPGLPRVHVAPLCMCFVAQIRPPVPWKEEGEVPAWMDVGVAQKLLD